MMLNAEREACRELMAAIERTLPELPEGCVSADALALWTRLGRTTATAEPTR
jgi:hypothetical protein